MSPDPEQYRLQIHDIRILATYLTLSEQTNAALNAKLSIGNLHYPFLGIDLTNIITIPEGTRQATLTLSRGEV